MSRQTLIFVSAVLGAIPGNLFNTDRLMAKYTMQEMNDLNNEGKTLLYPRLINSGSRGTDELASYIAECTSFSTADVKGVLDKYMKE